MKNLFALVGLVVVAFFGVGWYCGWYSLAVQPGDNGRKRIEFDLDTRKITDDTTQAGQKVGQFIQNHAPTPATAPAAPTLPTVRELVGPPAPPELPPAPKVPPVGVQFHVGSKTVTVGSER